ncbi:MAG: hypothetical protein KF692_11345 [Cryobacterium sp.]|nr:hypothetical protein [Cryobacterium sp.]
MGDGLVDEIAPVEREVTFHFPAFENDIEPKHIEFSVIRRVHLDSQINSAALEAWRDAPQAATPFADPMPDERFPSWFEVNLLRSNIQPEAYSGSADDVPILFGISGFGTDGDLVFNTEPGDSYRYNTFRDLDALAEWGLLSGGQRDHLVVRFTHGKGGDVYWGDLVGWLFNQGVDVAVELARDFIIFRLISPLFGHLRNGRRDRRARKIAASWHARGLRYPAQLRRFIDCQDSWTVDAVAKRLKIDGEAARQIMTALGLEADSRGTWRPGTSKRARRRRKRWESAETDY